MIPYEHTLEFDGREDQVERVVNDLLAVVTRQFPFHDGRQELQWRLLFSELVQNAVDHGAIGQEVPHLSVSIGWDDREMFVRVSDNGGLDFDPLFFQKGATRERESTGGRGIFMVENLVHRYMVVQEPGRFTRILLTLALPDTLTPTSR